MLTSLESLTLIGTSVSSELSDFIRTTQWKERRADEKVVSQAPNLFFPLTKRFPYTMLHVRNSSVSVLCSLREDSPNGVVYTLVSSDERSITLSIGPSNRSNETANGLQESMFNGLYLLVEPLASDKGKAAEYGVNVPQVSYSLGEHKINIHISSPNITKSLQFLGGLIERISDLDSLQPKHRLVSALYLLPTRSFVTRDHLPPNSGFSFPGTFFAENVVAAANQGKILYTGV